MARNTKQLGYTALQVIDVPLDAPLPFALYYRSNTHDDRLVLLRNQGGMLDQGARQQLLRQGIQQLFVQSRQPQRSRKRGRQTASMTEQRKKIERIRAQAVRTYSLASQHMQEILTDPSYGENIKQACSAVDDMVELIIEEDSSIEHLLSLTTHDYYTYTHCVNVCIYSLGLAHHIGHQDTKRLQAIGIGALLHDIGKSQVSASILTKPSRLSEEEWGQMKQHPVAGAEELLKQVNVLPGAIVSVLQHHERYDGSGYPRGLSGEAIHLFARISSLADVYDALTTNRSYRRAFSPRKALQIMTQDMAGDFDPALLSHFVAFIQIH